MSVDYNNINEEDLNKLIRITNEKLCREKNRLFYRLLTHRIYYTEENQKSVKKIEFYNKLLGIYQEEIENMNG